MAFWLLKKFKEILVNPGFNALKASYAPRNNATQLSDVSITFSVFWEYSQRDMLFDVYG